MPGLAGIITSDKNNLLAMKAHLQREMVWSEDYTINSFFTKDENLFLMSTAAIKALTSKVIIDNRFYSLLYGELLPIKHTDPSRKHQALVVDYLKNGPESLLKAHGGFQLLIYDTKTHKLSLINDGFSSYPLNYYHNESGLLFSSQLKPFKYMSSKPDLDEAAIAEMLALGFQLNGKTFLKNVQRIWPGTILEFKDGQLNEFNYFQPVFNPDKTKQPGERLAHQHSALEQAISARYSENEKTAIALSGGFDTRALLSHFLHKNANIEVITHGTSTSADMVIARQIAEHFQIPAKLYSSETVIEDPAKIIDYSDGYMSLLDGFLIPYYQLAAQNYDVLFDGAGGQLYRRQMKRRYSLPWNKYGSLTNFIFNYSVHDYFDNGLLEPDFVNVHRTLQKTQIETYLKKYRASGNNEDLLDLFHLHNSAGLKFSVDLLVQSHFIICRQPFYDLRPFSLNTTFSVNERKQLLFHKHIIGRNSPALEKFPLEYSNLIIPYEGFLWKRLRTQGLRLVNSKIKSPILDKYVKTYPLWNQAALLRGPLKGTIMEILTDQSTLSMPYWNRQKLSDITVKHMSDAGDYSATLDAVASMALTLKALK